MEYLVTNLLAILAKRKGFDYPVNHYISCSTISKPAKYESCEIPQDFNKFDTASLTSRPSRELLSRWLEMEHGITLRVYPRLEEGPLEETLKNPSFDFVINKLSLTEETSVRGDNLSSHKDSFEYMYKEALNLIPDKQ